MTETIRWGVLSTANIGAKRVIPAIQASRNGTVTAVASRSAERAQQFAAEHGLVSAYGSYEELLADPDVDAIYNPLPNSLHEEWSIKCAQAGKPTLCEKPLAGDAAAAQRMVDAFEEHGVLFAEAFMWRFHPQVERVQSMLKEGAIGDLHVMDGAFTFKLTREQDVRWSQDLDGGALLDVGCYPVNAMRLFAGEEPEAVHAFARFAPSGVDAQIAGVLSFPSGVLGHLDAALRTYRTNTLELRGSAGRIRLNVAFTAVDHDAVIDYWHGDSHEQITIPRADPYQRMAEDFADALLNNRPPRYPAQDGVKNMQVLDMLMRSAREA